MDLLGLIKPVLSQHAVTSGLDQLYSYDHNEKIRKKTVILSHWFIKVS